MADERLIAYVVLSTERASTESADNQHPLTIHSSIHLILTKDLPTYSYLFYFP